MLKLNVVVVAAGCALAACQGNKPAPTTSSAAPPVASTPPAPPPAPATAALTTPFEGEIVVNVKREAEEKVPISVTFDVKGERIRYAPAGSNVREVADVATKHAFAISDSKREYAAIDTKPSAPAAAEPKVMKSNFSQKFAGVACDDWTIDDPSGKVDVCVAKGVPFFDPANDAQKGKSEPAWAAALTREKAFPLRVIAYDAKGKEEYRAEATKVDAKKLDDALFQVPSGFKLADLSADLRSGGLP